MLNPDIDSPQPQLGELIDADFSAQDLARLCGVAPGWVQDRVTAGILQVDMHRGVAIELWLFDSVALVRARRIAQFEKNFDADPQLAALTTDLIEEVGRLRRRLLALGHDLAQR